MYPAYIGGDPTRFMPDMTLPRFLFQRLTVVLGILFAAMMVPAHAAIQTVGNVTNVTLSVDGTNGNVTANFWIDNGGEAAVTPVAADVVRVRYYFTALWSKEEPMIALQPSYWPTISNSVTFTDQGANLFDSDAATECHRHQKPVQGGFPGQERV